MMRHHPKFLPVCGSLRPVGSLAAELISNLKFRRQIQQLHGLGDRVLGEFLAEFGAERSIMTIIDTKLTRYTELDAEALEATSGDKFWPAPLHKVPRT